MQKTHALNTKPDRNAAEPGTESVTQRSAEKNGKPRRNEEVAEIRDRQFVFAYAFFGFTQKLPRLTNRRRFRTDPTAECAVQLNAVKNRVDVFNSANLGVNLPVFVLKSGKNASGYYENVGFVYTVCFNDAHDGFLNTVCFRAAALQPNGHRNGKVQQLFGIGHGCVSAFAAGRFNIVNGSGSAARPFRRRNLFI